MIKVGLIAANGKMGNEIVLQLKNNAAYVLQYAHVRDIPHENVKYAQYIVNEVNNIQDVDIIIDFSTPKLSMEVINLCQYKKIPLILGTTGFSNTEKEIIYKASVATPILFTPNTSLSVCVLLKAVELVSQKLPNFEVEIIEAHHRYKQDAPSGTALKIAQTIAQTKKISLDNSIRQNKRTNSQEIGMSVIRAGDIVGMHKVSFIANGETLSLKSEITNRASFASGAIFAIDFLMKQSAGLYSMLDVLGL